MAEDTSTSTSGNTSSGKGPGRADQLWARELAQQLVDEAKAYGAHGADAAVGVGSSVSAKARDGETEDVTRASSRAAGLRVIVDGRLGFATSACAPRDKAAVQELVHAAIELAKVATPSEHNVIPTATGPTGKDLEAKVRSLRLWNDSVVDAGAGWAVEQSLVMEDIVRRTEGISTVREVGASTRHSVFALATSGGFLGSYGGTMAQLHASAVVDDAGGKRQVDGWWSAARALKALEDPEAIAHEAARRALSRRGARKVATCRAPVIYDPPSARSFFGATLGALSGDIVSKRASFLAARKGEALLAPGFAFADDPTLVGGLGSRPFDGEGLATGPLLLFDDAGRLQSWILDARSASELGEQPTGHAARGATSLPGPSASNAVLTGGSGTLDDIVRETGKGLLVTHLLGHSPDMVTGEYSRGAAGFWIENGEIAFPVEEVTVAGDMVEMMGAIDRVGDDAEPRSSLRIPTIRFAELQISGS